MKDFLAISDGGPGDEERFICAETLATRFDGSLSLLVTALLPPINVVAGDPGMYVPLDDEGRQAAVARADRIVSGVTARFSNGKHKVDVSHIVDTQEAVSRGVAIAARTRDLCILSLPGEDDASALHGSIVSSVLVDGGRAVLGLPAASTGSSSFDTITIAWNGSRECARAVSQAMPFITSAKDVTVVLIDPALRQAGDAARPGDNIIKHLERHGVHATLARATRGDLSVSDAILAEADRTRSGLVVMGAQPDGGLMGWLRGSVSRNVFTATKIPLLMAA